MDRNIFANIFYISKNTVNEFAEQNGIMQKIKSINNDDDGHASSLHDDTWLIEKINDD